MNDLHSACVSHGNTAHAEGNVLTIVIIFFINKGNIYQGMP